MTFFDIIADTNKSTVFAEYIPEQRKSTDYQSEAALEDDFIKRLTDQGYEYIKIKNKDELINNLRRQLEKLNEFSFLDKEWEEFYTKNLASNNESILEKTRKIQDDSVQILTLENGMTKNIKLIDKKDIHNNKLQVLNQYEENEGTRQTRYDVTILINGFPLVHIELKRRGVAIREAFNQIKRYQRDSFWAGCGLFEYVQIFVISNGTHTKYYSNTTRNQHVKDINNINPQKKAKTSNSFEFTSYWADGKNKIIPDIVDFTKTFFAKHVLLNIITRYSVFTSENLLLVMRPYQIIGTERILNRIELATNYNKTGTIEAGGYIWHTTGSGKTLTSFKTAQLAKALPYIDKVLFVVDRKDLDYQTMKEYDRFEKGAANSNTSTKLLKKQLGDNNAKIIITTIQKLDKFVSRNKEHNIYQQPIVIIFDECHRSQFGDMHINIEKKFKNYYIFGFTGTPIFTGNSGNNKYPYLKTTAQAFGDKLHTYTIVDAIHDNNVLPFRIDYINTIKATEHIKDKKVKAIDTENALLDPKRIEEVTKYILEHFDQKTYRNQSRSAYDHRIIKNVKNMAASKNNTVEEQKESKKVNGFNSIFAVASIKMAMAYYNEFKKQLEQSGKKLNFATIFSYSPNEEDPNENSCETFIDEDFDNSKLDKTSRDFLDSAIKDYNAMFKVNYDTSVDKFPNYYKDVSLRMKNREIDILIVVNMFLTGFDATTLNTLWVDKNLREHGLIQSFSRTNRILNSVKTFGNIVCFRDLEYATNKALSRFGDSEAGNKEAVKVALLKTYKEYLNGYDEDGKHIQGYKELINKLETFYPVGTDIVGEDAEKDFIKLFGSILRLKNILVSFDEFSEEEIIPKRDFQDYQSKYIDLYQAYSKKDDAEKEKINDDIIFEIELIKQVEVNIDYILMLVIKYHESNCKDKTILVTIDKTISANIELRSKKDLIENFISQINANTDVDNDWRKFVTEHKEKELNTIIQEENLKAEEAKKFIDNAFRDGSIKTTGTDIDKILPPVSRFSGGDRTNKKQTVIAKLLTFFEKYFGLG
ncbi:type I restriction endonuclease subunit R [Desulfovibrio litoralis]|uniref:Type I restriction enzyme endonuclease subunit n=1 Tax=Desulfovibrio litoralis DSM 11393 TaxID=1121455 RepID=A0A1M7S0D0_9BACT|nr:type I restriction endonuclease subunit R [Desulfovibrio litoralis]SHN52039.1 type I restriction enzyme, R subunit [Desulfovibrio litoralis DSM 11393]